MKKRSWIIVIFILLIMIALVYNLLLKDIILKNFYKIEYKEIVQKYSNQYNVDEYLIYSIIKAESNFDANAVSYKGAKGLMQIMDTTAEDISKKSKIDFNKEDILDPDVNINLGTNYISSLIQKYGCIELALTAYNAGSGNVDSWIDNGTIKKDGSDIENVPYKETNNYVRKILNYYEAYKDIWI